MLPEVDYDLGEICFVFDFGKTAKHIINAGYLKNICFLFILLKF